MHPKALLPTKVDQCLSSTPVLTSALLAAHLRATLWHPPAAAAQGNSLNYNGTININVLILQGMTIPTQGREGLLACRVLAERASGTKKKS